MEAIKIGLTLFFLAAGMACGSQHVTRSYCTNNYQQFGSNAQRLLKGKFDSGFDEFKKFIAKYKPRKNEKKNPLYDDLVRAYETFEEKTAPLYVVAENKNVKQLSAYCEYLVGLYSWLHDKNKCGGHKDVFNAVCQPCAAQVQMLFEGSFDSPQSEPKQKVSYRPEPQAKENKKNNRNKYAHMKPKPQTFKSIEIPEEKKSEVVAATEFVREEVNFQSPKISDEERRTAKNAFHQMEEEEKPEVAIFLRPNIPQKRKRVIVVEVLACKDCKKDAFLQKYVVERK